MPVAVAYRFKSVTDAQQYISVRLWIRFRVLTKTCVTTVTERVGWRAEAGFVTSQLTGVSRLNEPRCGFLFLFFCLCVCVCVWCVWVRVCLCRMCVCVFHDENLPFNKTLSAFPMGVICDVTPARLWLKIPAGDWLQHERDVMLSRSVRLSPCFTEWKTVWARWGGLGMPAMRAFFSFRSITLTLIFWQ